MNESDNNYNRLWQQAISLFVNGLEYAKLTAAEKLTMLITGLAVAAGAFVLGIIFLFFLTIAIAHWIAPSIGLGWAYALMGVFYLALVVLLIVLCKPLIMNPVARFISRLFLK